MKKLRWGVLGVAKLMRFIPRSVMVGFVNALAILIFMAQIPYMVDVPWLVYPMIAVGLAIMVALPRVTTVVPAPLIAIVALTGFTVLASISVPDVGDDVCFYQYKTGESTIKRLDAMNRKSGQARLRPLNPLYDTFIVNMTHEDQLKRVVGVWRDYRFIRKRPGRMD